MRLPDLTGFTYYRRDSPSAQTSPNLAVVHDNKMLLSSPDGRTAWESCSVIDRAPGSSSSLRIVFRVRAGRGRYSGIGGIAAAAMLQSEGLVLCMHRRSNQLFYLFFGLAQPKNARP